MDRRQTLEQRLADLEAIVVNQADRIEALEAFIELARTLAASRLRFDPPVREEEAA